MSVLKMKHVCMYVCTYERIVIYMKFQIPPLLYFAFWSENELSPGMADRANDCNFYLDSFPSNWIWEREAHFQGKFCQLRLRCFLKEKNRNIVRAWPVSSYHFFISTLPSFPVWFIENEIAKRNSIKPKVKTLSFLDTKKEQASNLV